MKQLCLSKNNNHPIKGCTIRFNRIKITQNSVIISWFGALFDHSKIYIMCSSI
jgi:hypothetical protein